MLGEKCENSKLEIDLSRYIELGALWKICEKFISDHEIVCEESIYQVDSVSLDALEFIETICSIVGFTNSVPDQD